MGKEVVSPLVSIICNTYNHVNYIRQCLDGFLMQETNFPIEILVHDDASTDGTADIVREYEDKYPDLIKPIYQTENQYSKGVKVSLKYQYSRAKGKYIALCEGDDYWTDPLKLQKQVDFLETHKDYVICGHKFRSFLQNESRFISIDQNESGTYTLEDFTSQQRFCSTLTVVFKRASINLQELNEYPFLIDSIWFFYILKAGNGYCLNDTMAVYRLHGGGIWSSINYEDQLKLDFQVRLSLCRIDKSQEAALFLKILFTKPISRKFLLRNLALLFPTFSCLRKAFGYMDVMLLLFNKFILNKRIVCS